MAYRTYENDQARYVTSVDQIEESDYRLRDLTGYTVVIDNHHFNSLKAVRHLMAVLECSTREAFEYVWSLNLYQVENQ